MTLADALSRLPNPDKRQDVPLDIQVDDVTLTDCPVTQVIDLIHFGSAKQEVLQEETSHDPLLKELRQVIYAGWPDSIKGLPRDLRPYYWSYRDELGISCGVVFKGRQVLIPESMHNDILNRLHIGHMGVEKTRRLARNSVYWPKINEDIAKLVGECEPCQETQTRQQKEPLAPHDIPTTPWSKLGTDLFELNGQDYLIIVDYHSKFPVVHKMTSTTSAAVAQAKASTFGLLGAPVEMISDNGPNSLVPHIRICVPDG